MLSDLSPSFRLRVIHVLGSLGPVAKDARPTVLKLFQDKKDDLSYSTITAFVALHPVAKDAVPSLTPFLNVPGDGYSVYEALCEMGPNAKNAIPAIRRYVLNELAATEKDTSPHVGGLYLLSKLGEDAVPLLVEMFDAHGGHGRLDAIECLEELGPKAIKAAPALVKLLKHDDAETRYRAAALLWKLEKNPSAVSALVGLLAAEAKIDSSQFNGVTLKSNLAASAAQMLGEIGPSAKDALPALREAASWGASTSILSGTYYGLAMRKVEGASITWLDDDTYRISVRFRALAEVSRAATEAIKKIESEPK
jgi:HEAT repeat protein